MERTAQEPRRVPASIFPDDGRPTLAISADELARETEERIAAHPTERWLELADEGKIDMEKVPLLHVHRADLPWTECDDVEVHVLLRAAGGASIREMLRGSPHDCSDVVRAICRLGRRGVLGLV